MYWLYNGNQNAVPTVALHIMGRITEFDMQLVVESGESIENGILVCADGDHAGILQARLDINDAWMAIGSGLDPSCFLGSFAAGTHTVYFRVNPPDDQADGIVVIPLRLLYGDEICLPFPTFTEDLTIWSDDFLKTPWGGYDRDEDGYPIQEELHEAGGTINQFAAVFLDTADSRRIKAASNDSTLKESCVIGIVTDTGESYTFRDYGASAINPITGLIYEHGGIVSSALVNTMSVFDTSNRTWLADAVASTAKRKFHTVTYLSGKLYCWGGIGESDLSLNSIEIYDIAAGTWSSGTSGGTARYGHFAFVYGGAIYFVGGLDDAGDAVTDMDIYDPVEDSWAVAEVSPTLNPAESGAPPTLPMFCFDDVTNLLYQFGGYECGEMRVWDVANECEKGTQFKDNYDAHWSGAATLATVDGRSVMIVTGGQCLSNLDAEKSEVLTEQILLFWLDTQIMTFAGTAHTKRLLGQCQAYDGEFFCWGGRGDTDPQENMDRLVLATRENEILTFSETTRNVVKAGRVTNPAWSWTEGAQLYLGSTPGGYSETRPPSGHITIVGRALSATEIFVRPEIVS